MRKQAGFTLVVIAVLGILAATALPRFINVQSNARVAAGQGLAAAVRSAANLARASWVAAGASTSATTVTMDGQAVDVNVTTGTALGYPAATATGIVAALQSYDTTNVAVTYAGDVATFTVQGKTNCKLTYTAATGIVDTSGLTSGNCN